MRESEKLGESMPNQRKARWHRLAFLPSAEGRKLSHLCTFTFNCWGSVFVNLAPVITHQPHRSNDPRAPGSRILPRRPQVLFEDNSVNRMRESLDLFTEVAGNPIFEKTPIFVFLNKKDLFEEMIATKVCFTYGSIKPSSTFFVYFMGN